MSKPMITLLPYSFERLRDIRRELRELDGIDTPEIVRRKVNLIVEKLTISGGYKVSLPQSQWGA